MPLRWSVIGLGVLFVALQAVVLPPYGFFSGDQGAKYLEARAFADHPSNPGIDVRSRDIDPTYRYQEPILRNRGGRLVATFSWLLPILTAPFLAVLGLRGLYVIPALSGLIIFLAAGAIGRSLGEETGHWTAWAVVLTAPVFIYGSELWEHAPAAACVMVAAALLCPRSDDDAGPLTSRTAFLLAGVSIAIAALFREEAGLALPAFLLARVACGAPEGRREVLVGALWAAAGVGLVLLASLPVNHFVYGSLLPLHLTDETAKVTSFWSTRGQIAADLLLPGSYRVAFIVAALGGVAAAVLESRRASRLAPSASRLAPRASRTLLAVTHVCVLTLLTIGVFIPLWRELVGGVLPYFAYSTISAAHTWPFCFALLYWPWLAPRVRGNAGRFVLLSAILLTAGALAIIPSSGGAQWSPRYLFVAAPLLAALAAAAVRGANSQALGVTRAARGILIASLVMQTGGFLYLRGAKVRNARLTDTVAARTADGFVLLTDLYWFPEVTATLASSRRMLFSWDASDIPAMAALAARRGLPAFAVVLAPTTDYTAPAEIDVPGVCRFSVGAHIPLDELGLSMSRYACAGDR